MVTDGSFPGIYNMTGTGEGVVGKVIYADSPAKPAQAGNDKTNMDNYVVSYNLELTIEFVSITGAEVTYDGASFTYDGTEHQPTVNFVKLGDKILEPYNPETKLGDYEIDVTPQVNVPEPIDGKPGHYTFKVIGHNLYGGEIEKEWTINPREVTVSATYDEASSYYTANAKKTYDNFALYTEYGPRQIANIVSGDIITGKLHTITSSSNGEGVHAGIYNYSGTGTGVVGTFEDVDLKFGQKEDGTMTFERNYIVKYDNVKLKINQKSITSEDVEISDVVNPEYDGTPQVPVVVIHDKSTGLDLIVGPNGDYVIEGAQTDHNDDGEYGFVVNGTENGNYSGTKTYENIWNVDPRTVILSLEDEKVFDGNPFVRDFTSADFMRLDGKQAVVTGQDITGTITSVDSAVGAYEYASDGSAVEFVKEPTVDGTKATNYNILKADGSAEFDGKGIVLTINEAPAPEPTPEHGGVAQTGDTTPIAGLAIISLALIGAFLAFRRRYCHQTK